MRISLMACATLLWALSSTSGAEVLQVDNAELAKLIEQGVPVVDIRTKDEWQTTGVIKDSHLFTFFDEQGRYDVNGWLAELATIAKPDQQIAIICLVGSRSMVLSHFLDTKAGYSNVINVTRGIDRWIKDGNPTVAHP
ncbi:MAG: rhodanese-like domain-containing protein [Gammaproteobacteria bacterium]|nr:rhodanese-like domain-containing protein [Gammaproteobacteria bacterium]